MSRGQNQAVDWSDPSAPRSPRFGDVYFSSEDGLAESRAVFLAGCGLPEAWAGRTHFCVGELGFGSGLNIAALLKLWKDTASKNGRLSIFSIEGFPIAKSDAARALATWPELSAESAALLAAWPSAARGFHRIELPAWRATLDVAILDVETALAEWSGVADAWFLDGFAPALNPDMWSERVLAAVAGRSAPGARAATFTVAGTVRRGLTAAGFAVEKRPGHGRKRERLEARLPGAGPASAQIRRIAIVGGGIAGASLKRALRSQGLDPVIIDDGRMAASGNPAALVTPGLDASGRATARFYAQAYGRAIDLYHQDGLALAQGVLRRPRQARDETRFAKVAEQDIFAPGSVSWRPGEGLVFHDGLTVEPAKVLAAWGGATMPMHVESLGRLDGVWRLEGDGKVVEAEVVILAAGWGAKDLAPLALEPIRGQASFTQSPARPGATVDGDYMIPTADGFLFGATHDRGRQDTDISDEDHRRNLAALARLAPGLAERLTPSDLSGRAAVRAATPDRLPLAGRLDEGLFVLGGLGSRGFTTAPLLAEHVAALVMDFPSPLPRSIAALVDPRRAAR